MRVTAIIAGHHSSYIDEMVGLFESSTLSVTYKVMVDVASLLNERMSLAHALGKEKRFIILCNAFITGLVLQKVCIYSIYSHLYIVTTCILKRNWLYIYLWVGLLYIDL